MKNKRNLTDYFSYLSGTLYMATVVLLIMLNFSFATKIDSLTEIFKLDQTGKASVTWLLEIRQNFSRELLLPWNFLAEPDLSVEFRIVVSSSGGLKDDLTSNSNLENTTPAFLIEKEGVRFVKIILPDTLPVVMKIQFEIPEFYNFQKEKKSDFGNYSFKKRYSNTSISEIKSFSSEIVFPAGFDITTINETIPQQSEDDPVTPYQISRREGKNCVILKSDGLKLGEDVFIKLQIKSSQKSPYLWIGIVLIGMMYLIYFRDLVKFKKVTPVVKES